MASMTQDKSEVPGRVRRSLSYRLDDAMSRSSERLNPILVKEARQALKSRQFVITFALLLLSGWIWSLMGIAQLLPGVYYEPSGPYMLAGYLVVLLVPMLLIVPFSAFRSLAAEREDGTYELVSITGLSARQIVTGKLGSAVLQMLIYYSALCPCIAFTYLLRGIDILTILLILYYIFAASLVLSAAGLLTATLSRARHVQVLLSVVFLLVLGLTTLIACVWTAGALLEQDLNVSLDEGSFWVLQLAVLTACSSYLVLFVFAAAAQLTFASDNRSTKLRVIVLATSAVHGLDDGLVDALRGRRDSPDAHPLLGSPLDGDGVVAIGGVAQLSPRVKRQLPQSFLGRIFLTWFNPGSGTGYVLAVASLLSVTGLALTAALLRPRLRGAAFSVDFSNLFVIGLLVCAYVTIYLGIGRLLTLWLRRWFPWGFWLPLLINAALLAAGVAVPLFLQAWITAGVPYMAVNALLQAPNWAWTIDEASNSISVLDLSVVVVLAVIAIPIFLVNLALATEELEQVRQEQPTRFRSDER